MQELNLVCRSSDSSRLRQLTGSFFVNEDTGELYNDFEVYQRLNGVVLVKYEGKHNARALGDKKAGIL